MDTFNTVVKFFRDCGPFLYPSLAMLTLGLNQNAVMVGGEFVLSHHDRVSLSAGLNYLGGDRDKTLTGSAKLKIKF